MIYISNSRDLPGPNDPECWPPYAGHPNDPRGHDDEPDFSATAEVMLSECSDIAVAGMLAWDWEILETRIADILQALALHNDGTAANDQAVGKLVRSLVMEELESVAERTFEPEIEKEEF